MPAPSTRTPPGCGVRFAGILDGLSQTLIAGERSSKYAPSTRTGMVTGGEHAPARIVGGAAFPPNSESELEHYMHNFSSYHPSGTNFLSGDGSVRLIAETIDRQVYRALATRASRDVAGPHGSGAVARRLPAREGRPDPSK